MKTKPKTVVELKKLTKFYGKYRGVESIDLRVKAGTIFGFLGPNGAGKTTTISMMVGLLNPTKGSIRLFGKDNDEFLLQSQAKIGYLAGDMALDGGLTGWQELEYFGKLRGKFDKAYIEELAERLECDLGRKIKTLSRGNKQKVALISALMHKPELLILDEPTSGLDPLIQMQFNEIIHEHKKAGKTAFISSHVLSEVQEICDEAGFIKEGKLIANMPLKELFKTAPKQISIALRGKELVEFEKIKGVLHVERTGDTIHFTYTGNMSQLLKLLSGQPMKDISITDADLETVFMKFYQKGGSNA